jgi:hypothetical protein
LKRAKALFMGSRGGFQTRPYKWLSFAHGGTFNGYFDPRIKDLPSNFWRACGKQIFQKLSIGKAPRGFQKSGGAFFVSTPARRSAMMFPAIRGAENSGGNPIWLRRSEP